MEEYEKAFVRAKTANSCGCLEYKVVSETNN